MAEAATVTHLSNGIAGTGLPPAKSLDEQEYKKILDLYHDIVRGSHPRLKISLTAPPEKSLSHQSPISSTTISLHTSKDVARAPNGVPQASSGDKSQSAPGSGTGPALQAAVKQSDSRNGITREKPLSQLDPIFLEKSDDLIRAEFRLQRQRLEKEVQEHASRQRAMMRRLEESELIPDFDVTEVLYQAQELVPPEVGLANGGNNRPLSASDSSDKTYYSSGVQDVTTEEGEEKPERPKKPTSAPCPWFFKGSCKKGDRCNYSHDPSFRNQLDREQVSNKRKPDNHVVRRESPDYGAANVEAYRENQGIPPAADDFPRGEDTEGEYSSTSKLPRAHKDARPPFDKQDRRMKDRGKAHPRQKEFHAIDVDPEKYRSIRRTPPSPRDVGANKEIRPVQEPSSAQKVSSIRVVQNNITSPLAPQPARVSPLAFAKAPKLTQAQQDGGRRVLQRNGSPIHDPDDSARSANTPLNIRKRRREPDVAESIRSAVPRTVANPEPYIKQEPLSPLPMSAMPLRRDSENGQYSRAPIILEAPGSYNREAIVYESRPPTYEQPIEINDHRSPQPQIIRRTSSRAGHYFETNPEPNLRRMIVNRELHRIPSPSQRPPVQQRALPQTYAAPLEREPPRYRELSVHPQAAAPVRYKRSPSPPSPVHAYDAYDQEGIAMAPPPGRIIMDRAGNRYYEASVPQLRAASVMPVRYVNEAPSSRYVDATPQFDGQYERRESVRYMAPPSDTNPRYVEYYAEPPPPPPKRVDRAQSVYQPAYETVTESMRPPPVQILDYQDPRAEPRYIQEEVPRPREAYTRLQSVQPGRAPSRYEVVQDPQPSQMMPTAHPNGTSVKHRPQYEVYQEPLAPPQLRQPAYQQQQQQPPSRMQSVRPDQQHVVTMPQYTREAEPMYVRHSSVRAPEPYGNGYGAHHQGPPLPPPPPPPQCVGQAVYAHAEQPRYMYDRRGTGDDDVVMEGTREGPSRSVVRM
ncbi:hypothetical protein MMC25_002885 [Agyrium rufum]|nr:hypothetical protein [Agyrium rufum]